MVPISVCRLFTIYFADAIGSANETECVRSHRGQPIIAMRTDTFVRRIVPELQRQWNVHDGALRSQAIHNVSDRRRQQLLVADE